jgi:5'-nucleotidase
MGTRRRAAGLRTLVTVTALAGTICLVPIGEASGSASGTAQRDVLTPGDVQGTGDVSPLVGTEVAVGGVVTAAYPTGGLSGFVLESPAGGAEQGSHAVFVSVTDAPFTVVEHDRVTVSGRVREVNGLTTVVASASTVVDDGPAAPDEWPQPSALPWPDTPTDLEAHESELVTLPATTVTDNKAIQGAGQIRLAVGATPLVRPTDVVDPHDQAAIDALTASNQARLVILDDGSTWDYRTATYGSNPLPWLTQSTPVRVGAAANLAPTVLDYRGGGWRLQPTRQVVGDGQFAATFADARSGNSAPAPVGGNLRLASYNLQTYFTTYPADYAAQLHRPSACTPILDRSGVPVAVSACPPNGPLGAWDVANQQRQAAKEVATLATMDADVVALQEVENSAQFRQGRDATLAALVSTLNVAAGHTRWAYVPSPPRSALPRRSYQAVLRSAFIYDPATVSPVGKSVVLVGKSGPGQPFANAREPLAQVFKKAGAQDSDGFLVVDNHFKANGAAGAPARGPNALGDQGTFNAERVREARALVSFATGVASARGTDRVFLAGDFNSYRREDPIHVLRKAGYALLDSGDPGDASYVANGLSGSIDHVLANPAAQSLVTGADTWETDAQESPAYSFRYYNGNVTQLYSADVFRSSDHNPVVVGLNAPDSTQVSVRARAVRYGHRPRIHVLVSSGEGLGTGLVRVSIGHHRLGKARLVRGRATYVVHRRLVPGGKPVVAKYTGDATHAAAIGSTTLTVAKARPVMRDTVWPRHPRVGVRTRVRLTVTGHNHRVRGQVRLTVGEQTYTRTLRRGVVKLSLAKYIKPGRHKVKVTYLGTTFDARATKVVKFSVSR